jgi:hypothetical protein
MDSPMDKEKENELCLEARPEPEHGQLPDDDLHNHSTAAKMLLAIVSCNKQALVMQYYRRGSMARALSTLWYHDLTEVQRLNYGVQASPTYYACGTRFWHACCQLKQKRNQTCSLSQLFSAYPTTDEALSIDCDLFKEAFTVNFGGQQPQKQAELDRALRCGPCAQLYCPAKVASGMAYLHSRHPAPGILHGDLKTSNLLLEDDGQRVVISDFGLAGWLIAGAQSAAENMGALTTIIAPPEVRCLFSAACAHRATTHLHAFCHIRTEHEH